MKVYDYIIHKLGLTISMNMLPMPENLMYATIYLLGEDIYSVSQSTAVQRTTKMPTPEKLKNVGELGGCDIMYVSEVPSHGLRLTQFPIIGYRLLGKTRAGKSTVGIFFSCLRSKFLSLLITQFINDAYNAPISEPIVKSTSGMDSDTDKISYMKPGILLDGRETFLIDTIGLGG